MKAINKKFYNLFWTNPTCKKIFSVHKAQLLENEVELIVSKEKFYAQRIVLTNSQKRKTGNQIIKRSENESIELVHNLQIAVKKYFDDDKIELFFNNKFGKAIKKIETDLQKPGGWIKIGMRILLSVNDEQIFYKLLSEYDLIPSEIVTREQFNAYVDAELKNQTKEFLGKQNLSDLAISIDLLSTYYNHKIKNNLVSATRHFTDILFDNENFQSRLVFFDELYEIGVLNGGKLKSYYECVNCPPNTLSGILTTNIKPSKVKLKCPSCNNEMLYIVPYEIENTIYENIVDKDGLLFFAIKNLLESNNYKFVANKTFLKDVEIDFCIQSEDDELIEMIEVKMFKTDRPNDTQIGNIRDAVSKIKNAIDKLSKHDPNFISIPKSLVTNIENELVYMQVKEELEKDLKAYGIKLYSMAEFYSKTKR